MTFKKLSVTHLVHITFTDFHCYKLVHNRRITPCASRPDITNKLLKQILKTRAQLRGSAKYCAIQEGCDNFPKIWKPPQNSMRLTGVMKQVPY